MFTRLLRAIANKIMVKRGRKKFFTHVLHFESLGNEIWSVMIKKPKCIFKHTMQSQKTLGALLVLIGACWSLLALIGAYCCLLVFIGPYWFLFWLIGAY